MGLLIHSSCEILRLRFIFYSFSYSFFAPLPWFLILTYLLKVCTLHFFIHSTVPGRGRISGWAGDSESPWIWLRHPPRPRTPEPGPASLGFISFPEGFMFFHILPSAHAVPQSRVPLSAFPNFPLRLRLYQFLSQNWSPVPRMKSLSLFFTYSALPQVSWWFTLISYPVLSKHRWVAPQTMRNSLISFYVDASTISNLTYSSHNLSWVDVMKVCTGVQEYKKSCEQKCPMLTQEVSSIFIREWTTIESEPRDMWRLEPEVSFRRWVRKTGNLCSILLSVCALQVLWPQTFFGNYSKTIWSNFKLLNFLLMAATLCSFSGIFVRSLFFSQF